MRLIQIHVPNDALAAAREALTGADLTFVFTDEMGGGGGAVAQIVAPDGAVDAILNELYDAGVDESTYTVVTEAERAPVPNAEELNERYVEGPGGAALSHPEIRKRAADLKPERATYVAFAALSAIVAVGGLLLNSPVVIVGAMVIAPFAGSTLSASVGTVIDDRGMVVDSASSQAIGLAVAVGSAVLMSLFLRWTGFVPPSLAVSRIDQVSAFLTPSLLTLFIAVAAGFAGALALATDLPVSIAGVAVAAAIVPTAATAGIGAVWGEPLVVLGAIALLLMNIVSINIAASVGLVSLGYRLSMFGGVPPDIGLSLRTSAYALVLAAFLAVVFVTVLATAQHIVFEQAVNRNVQDVLDDETYESLELVGVKTGYSDMNLLGDAESVTVTVSRTDDGEYADLAATLRNRISEGTNRPVAVNVRFVDYQRSRPAAESDENPYSRLLTGLREFWDTLSRTVSSGVL